MSIFEAIRLALSALWANRLRSTLTLVGAIVGVMSVITIISAIEGLMSTVEDQVNMLGPATFIVTKFGIITSHEEFLDALKRDDFTMDDHRAVEKGCRDCRRVAAYASRGTKIKRGNQALRDVPLLGTTADYIDIIDFEVGDGRSFTEQEYDHRNRVIFVGPTIVDELFDGRDPIGKTVKLKGRKFTIVGVAKRRGAVLGNNQDSFAMIPLSTYIKVYGRPRGSLDIMIESSTVAGIDDTMDQVRSILRARRGVDYKAEDDFAILTADNIMKFFNDITRIARFILIGISSIAMVIGGIVIMNIMMVSVTERTREIGIQKSIGARQKNILAQFLFESLLLSVAGGVIGTGLGLVMGALLGSLISLPVSPSVFAIIAGISISSIVGVMSGIYPAWKAARLDPIEALGYEK